jgi:hypothetical protein
MEATAEGQPVQWDERIFERLTHLSVRGDYTPFKLFNWPDRLPDQEWWMSPELLSVYDTPLMDELDATTLKRLSKWESINFYSLNVHGIREPHTFARVRRAVGIFSPLHRRRKRPHVVLCRILSSVWR